VKKNQRRSGDLDSKILIPIRKGNDNPKHHYHLQGEEKYDTLVSPALMALSGSSEAIKATFSDTKIQLCAAYQIRNSLKYVSYKDRKTVTADLKSIYQFGKRRRSQDAPRNGIHSIPLSAEAGD